MLRPIFSHVDNVNVFVVALGLHSQGRCFKRHVPSFLQRTYHPKDVVRFTCVCVFYLTQSRY